MAPTGDEARAANLLEMIAEQVPDLPWLRMLYIYPSRDAAGWST
jgi:hypothetical protein